MSYSVETSSLSQYLQELDRHPLLESGEFDRLIGKAQAGDTDAFNRILQGNLRFVVRIASEYSRAGLPLDDLIAEGNLGLIKAVEKFDVDLGYQFTTYAVWWIRNSIQRAIRSHVHSVRLPTNRYEDFDRLRKSASRLAQKLGREVTAGEVGSNLHMTDARTQAAQNVQNYSISMDAPAHETGPRTLHEAIPSKGETPEEAVIELQKVERIQDALSKLNVRDAEIISLTFGFDDEPLNLSRVGEKFGISKERVRQLRNRALSQLQALLSGQDGFAN